jgi:hypothetical protein
MASAARSLRLGLRASGFVTVTRSAPRLIASKPRITTRAISSTPRRWRQDDFKGDMGDEGEARPVMTTFSSAPPTEGEGPYADLIDAIAHMNEEAGRPPFTAKDRVETLKRLQDDGSVEDNMEFFQQMDVESARKIYALGQAMKTPPQRIMDQTFWSYEEEDPDLVEDDDSEEPAQDIMSMAHGKFEEYREYREYARLAAWQMPLLSSECLRLAAFWYSHAR